MVTIVLLIHIIGTRTFPSEQYYQLKILSAVNPGSEVVATEYWRFMIAHIDWGYALV